MASRYKAKRAARRTSKKVYRGNIRKPKRQVVKKFANFAGKVAFKKVSKMRSKRRYSKRRKYGRRY